MLENLWWRWPSLTQTKKHTNMQIPCLTVTLISVLHHPGNSTHNFLFTQDTWGLPPLKAGDGISCSVGMIIIGISKKRRNVMWLDNDGSAETATTFLSGRDRVCFMCLILPESKYSTVPVWYYTFSLNFHLHCFVQLFCFQVSCVSLRLCVHISFTSPFGLSSQSESVRSSLVSIEACVLSLYETLASDSGQRKITRKNTFINSAPLLPNSIRSNI